jgi:hypothetical protein
MVENTGHVAQLLRARYPQARVNVIDFGLEPNMGMREQVSRSSSDARHT